MSIGNVVYVNRHATDLLNLVHETLESVSTPTLPSF